MTKAATILIRNAFSIMKDKSDLVTVLNIAKKELYGGNSKPIILNTLTYYANHNLAKNRYSIFYIPKKSGGVRTIHAPVPGLKAVLKALNLIFQSVYEDHFDKTSSGFTPGKSVVDNARVHTGKEFVYNLDLKDFFPSIELYRVKAVLMLPPFNLTNEREPLAYLIANLCCHNMMVERIQDGKVVKKMHPVLPQGAPTSPTLTNIVCRRLDFLLKAVAKRFGVVYSRYADDITFSGNKNIYTPDGVFLTEVRRIIEQQRFVVNEDKVRLQRPWQRQEVTGITVNKSTNVERRYVKQVRQWLYLWETYGQAKAEQLFQRDYVAVKGFTVQSVPSLDRVVEGKLRYMKMVVGEENSTWRKLWERYTTLTDDTDTSQVDHPHPDSIYTTITQVSNSMIAKTSTSPAEEKNPLPIGENTPIWITKNADHNPKNTAELLNALYLDPVIKAALHKWDGVENAEESSVLVNNFDHAAFLSELSTRVNALIFKYKVRKELDTKIKYFFYLKDYSEGTGWSEDRIQYGWNTPNLIEWCSNNKGEWPAVYDSIDYEGFVFKDELLLKNSKIKIKSFKDVIQKFIHEIRFKKTDFWDNDPKSFLGRVFLDKDLQLDNQIVEGIEFYADVEKFHQALRVLKRGIKENIEKGKNLKIRVQDSSQKTVFEITHLSSYIDKTLRSFHEHDGDTIGGAKKLLKSVCDWEMEAKFTDGAFHYPLLISSEKELVKPLEKAEGVKHIFTFHKPDK